MPNDRTAAASKIKPRWAAMGTPQATAGSALAKAIASSTNRGITREMYRVNAPAHLPNATTQLVMGEVARSSRVPRLRSSA